MKLPYPSSSEVKVFAPCDCCEEGTPWYDCPKLALVKSYQLPVVDDPLDPNFGDVALSVSEWEQFVEFLLSQHGTDSKFVYIEDTP